MYRYEDDNERGGDMWWQEVLWGFWNGLSSWVVLIVHAFGGWHEYPFFDTARSGNWYDCGFLLGAGSPLLGAFGSGKRTASGAARQSSERTER
jgi:hypothetical protein